MSFPISRYLHIKQAWAPAFSSNGRFLTFLANITGTPQAWRIPLDYAATQPPWPEQLTFDADRVLHVSHSPARDTNLLLYAQDIGGNENAQLVLLNPDTGTEAYLSAGYENSMHIPGRWAANGRSFLFAANRRHPALFDLYLQPIDGPAQLIWEHEQTGYLRQATFSPDGKKVALIRVGRSFAHDLLEIDLATGTARQLNQPDEPARFTDIAYSPDGRFLYVNTDRQSEYLHIERLELLTGDWESLVHPNWDIETMRLAPNGRYLAYTINQDGHSQLELIDFALSTSRAAPLPHTTPGVIGWYDGYLTFSPDSSRLAFSYTTATQTSDIYIWHVDIREDQLYPVTRSTHGGIPPASFIPPELIHYPTFDNRHIPAWYYRPRHATPPWPAIVMVHGGPESQFRPYFHFLVQYFLQHGYAILAPNVRGSTGYGKQYSHLDDVEKRMDAVADLAHAAQWLHTRPEIDPERIAVYGGSYGGFMVLSALANYPHLWAAGVDIVGISNFVTFLENTSDYRRAHRESEYGSLATHRDFLESISPLHHVDKISAPLMVIHGANDPRVPLSEAEQLVNALRARQVPVEFLVFDDEGHGIAKLKNKLVAYPAIVSFLDTHLRSRR
ncbi:MAG: S9 family peptidase [Chloroflexi bacterium]|nr:MAG: S9 family peptidase [Chloroflexota bacterium]